MITVRRLGPLALLLACFLLVGGCAKKVCPPGPLLPFDAWSEVRDLQTLPQDPSAYIALAQERWVAPETAVLQAENERSVQRFFAPWKQQHSGLTAEQAFWGIASYGGKQGHGENLRPRPASWSQALVAAMRTTEFPSRADHGITVRNSSLRVMPTARPFFYSPRDAGEGFPFDYFQNSAVWVGTPVFVSHQSRDGAWVFVETGFASGWVPTQDVALVDDAFMERYATAPLVAVLGDDTAVRSPTGDFICTAHVGALFPRASDNAPASAVLAPARRPDGQGVLLQALLPGDATAPFPLPLSPENVAAVAKAVSGQLYGWGGMYENRDCSAMVRDIFTPFGIWLPRNSKPQARQGRVIELEALSPEDKEQALLRDGIPFRTLVGMPGHIMLYLGERDGRAMVFHNIWGLRTLDDCGLTGRQIIGAAVVTTLTPGEELEDVRRADRFPRDRVTSLAILAEPAP